MSDRYHPPVCRRCGHKARDRMDVSSRGLCRPCGELVLTTNIRDVSTKSGEGWAKWAAGMLAAALRYTGTHPLGS